MLATCVKTLYRVTIQMKHLQQLLRFLKRQFALTGFNSHANWLPPSRMILKGKT